MPDEYNEEIIGDEESEDSFELPELDEIDKTFLDVQSIELESLFREWAMYGEDLRENQESWKAHAENTYANLDRDMREKNPAANETKLKKIIELQPEYVEAQTSYMSALTQYRKVTTFLTVLDIRKKTIDNLIKLYGMQYWSISASPDHAAATKLVAEIRNQKK